MAILYLFFFDCYGLALEFSGALGDSQEFSGALKVHLANGGQGGTFIRKKLRGVPENC